MNNQKNLSELNYWKSIQEKEIFFVNHGYKNNMLRLINKEQSFFDNKVVADFGCGPRGSLKWLDNALLRIGIDINVDLYADEFKENILSHNMFYIKCTEKVIPLPNNSIDVLLTMNAMDHVDNFEVMCNEIIRILKPGGIFAGYFNLEEPITSCEPQMLNKKIIYDALLSKLNIIKIEQAVEGPKGGRYDPFYEKEKYSEYKEGNIGLLWAVATKK